jgi:hypothetical protein
VGRADAVVDVEPSGSAPITVTARPASVNTCGEMPAAAPFAQSMTTCRPVEADVERAEQWTT